MGANTTGSGGARLTINGSETLDDLTEAFAHLCAALTHADGEMRDMIREDIDRIIDRANELRSR